MSARMDHDILIEALTALGELLDVKEPFELASPLPIEVQDAAAMVARTLQGLPEHWFGDSRTAGILHFSLPAGFTARLQPCEFLPGLRLQLPHRRDIVALKVLAATSIGAADRDSKHMQDLRQLRPTKSELEGDRSWIELQTVPGDPQHHDLAAVLQQLRTGS